MNDFAKAEALILQGGERGGVSTELRRQFAANPPLPRLAQGQQTVADARATYTLRRRTTLAAGIEVVGLDALLEALAGLEPRVSLRVFHFDDCNRLLSVFTNSDVDFVVGWFALKKASADDAQRQRVPRLSDET